MAVFDDSGNYLYDYTDPEYHGTQTGTSKIKYLPEHFCPKEYFSAYTKYLIRLSSIIHEEQRRLQKERTWAELCVSEDYGKLQMYSLAVSIRLNNSAKTDAENAGVKNLRDYYSQKIGEEAFGLL